VRTLQRLYLTDFLKLLFLIAVGLSSVFSLLDLVSRIDNFLPTKPPAGSLLLYAFLTMPRFFLYLLPMSVLICSLFTFSQAARRKEITAIKAAGGRLRTLFTPFIVTGLILSVFALLIGEFLVPDFTRRAAELRNRLEGNTKTTSFTEGAIWIKNRHGDPVKIELYVPEKKVARNISIFIQGGNFLKGIISAKKATWNDSDRTWVLTKVILHDNETGQVQNLDVMNYDDLDSPEVFSREIKTSDEMEIAELYRYIQKLKSAGFQNVKLLVDLNSKVSFPVINIFMMLLGISLSGRATMGGGLFTAGFGLVISLLYWFGYTFSLSIGYAGLLPPFIAAWIIPTAFGALAVYLFLKTPE
jgi:lipopolysaccharide export system permease protein